MAPKRKPKSQLSRTAKFYRDNPRAVKKKDAKSKEVNKRPDQRKKRTSLSTKRRQLKRKGVNLKGKDLAHQTEVTVKLQKETENQEVKRKNKQNDSINFNKSNRNSPICSNCRCNFSCIYIQEQP